MPTRNMESIKDKNMQRTQKHLYEQFHELADTASMRLLLIYIVEKADHDPVYMRKIQFTPEIS